MHRTPDRPPRSPGAPRPPGRFHSPASGWGFPGARSPYGGSGFPGARSPFGGTGFRGASPRGCGVYSPGSPAYSPGSGREFGNGSPAGFGSSPRNFSGPMRPRGDGFRRPPSFGPGPAPNFQASNSSVEKYLSPSMIEDPWKHLQPLTTTDATHSRHTT